MPIADVELVMMASAAVLAAQHFLRKVDDWEGLPAVDRLWRAWKVAFRLAHLKRQRQLQASGGGEPLGGAHTVLPAPGVSIDRLGTALDNLALAAANDTTVLQQLTAVNLALTTSNAMLTAANKKLRKETATKIHGQPMDHDVTLLEKELIAIAATIPTTLGGGNHGHAGLIVEPAKYLTMTGGIAFVQPGNPGIYPAGLALNAAAGTRAREEALHKELIAQYEIHKGVEQALKDIIIEAVDEDFLLEIEDEILGFLNKTPRTMITHLRNQGGALDFADTKMQVRFPHFILTELKKQHNNSPELE
jgi:hypothetical protein